MKNSGLVHLYCGDGKGKTTAAVGLAVRHSGRGARDFKAIWTRAISAKRRSFHCAVLP